MKVSSSLKVLIVDDCLDTRNYIKMILRKKGFKKIVSASNGEEALEILKQSADEFEPVGLILADWQMPILDGLQFLTKVRLDENYKNVPFIMITADNNHEHVMQVINVGVSNYIVKPIKGDVLLKKVVETLSQVQAG